MNYKIIIILFIILISATSAVSIENTSEENKRKSAIDIDYTFNDKKKTLIIEDLSTKKKLFKIQQISVKPDLVTMEEIFKFTSYEDYAFNTTKDFKVRWDKVKGKNNIIKSKWEILENVEYSATVPDYIDIEKQITIYNIQSHEDVTDIYDNNPWLLDFGELHATNKWTVTSPNGTVTIGFENHVGNSTNPLNMTFYWNTTEQIDTHIEPKYRKDWRPFSPADKKIKKGESITVKLTFYKKAEKGVFSIKTIPMFAGVEEEDFAWWDGSWNYCVNNQISDGIKPYQLPVTINNSAGTNTATNVYFNGHANPDFSDIRFTLDDTTVLPYWIEDNGPTGKVWVNVIDNGVVNIYYGNPSATDESNGKGTFEFFDDFSNIDMGSNPVLSPTEPWESPDLRWGSIAYLNGIYYIYYSSLSHSTNDIGRATSTDLIHWTKYTGNPVIYDRIGPSLLKELDGITPVFYNNKYWMLTMKNDGTAIELRTAPSIDSNTWTLENGHLISKVPGTWYENYLYTTSFFRDNGKYYISMEARDNSKIWKIGLFDGGSSPTGPYNNQGVLLSPTLPWEGNGILDPEMRKFGNTYYLFYTGNVDKSTYQNSYATSSNLGGPYVKSDIKITPISNTYPAILKKDDFYYILTDDHTPVTGIGKNLYKRKDLNGMFGSPFEWYQVGSPTVSNSELLINADGEYIRSQSEFLYKAMKIRAKFPPLSDQNTHQYFGFVANSFAGVDNLEMIASYDDPDLKAWSGNSVNYESSSIFDASYFGSYHDYEILWRNGETKIIVDDVLKTTQTTYVADTPQPVGIYNYQTNANLYVDWIFVRNYVFPELSWAIWSIEHTSTGYPPTITYLSPVETVNNYEDQSRTFNINIDQSVDVVWYLNDDVVKNSEMDVTQATYTNNSASIGTWNIRAITTNTNGEAVQTWTWIVSSSGTSPEIIFTDPTPADDATNIRGHAYINTLVTNSSTAFIDWNNSLAGWWRFNSEDGETSTLFRDWSSYGNDVTCSGTNCPNIISGKFGNALRFDGSDDYISTTSTSGIPVTSPFTIESWVNAQSVSKWMDIFRNEGSWAVKINPEGKINLEITGKQDTISNVVIPANVWIHLAVTFEGTTVNFYKDGILSDTKKQINISDTGSNSIYIGGYNSWYFNGALDEIKIHNRVLSPDEIKASYDAGTNELYRDFTNLEDGTYHYKACAQNLLGNVDQTQTRTLTVTSLDAPIITGFSPASPVSDEEGESREFSIDIDQNVNVTWYLNDEMVQDNEKNVIKANYTNNSASIGTWNVIATATNANGDVSKEWTWNVISQSPSDDHLSAYWNLDENTGTTVSDSSGNGNTGTVYGSTWTTGKKGFALQFDGVNDYVDAGSTPGFSKGFTILMWAKRDAGYTWMTLISKGESTLEKDHNYVLYFTPTNALEFAIGDGINYRSFKTTNTYDTNWHHLAVEFVSSDDMRIYVDGVLQPGTYDPNGIATTPVANSKKTLIGASGTTTEFFNGVIDEVKIYNRVLTADEIAQDYNS